MPLGESMISILKSNKNIMLDKSRRFRKNKGSFDWSKDQLIDFPKASEGELKKIRERIQKENRGSRISEWIIFSIIFVITFSAFLYLIQ